MYPADLNSSGIGSHSPTPAASFGPSNYIRLIAEETIEAFGDDWFIYLVLQSDWCSFPFYAAGFQEVWDRLGEQFPGMELGLANSTSFASRILWMPKLRGQPLFEYHPERDPSFWRRLTGSGRIESTLTPAVFNFLGGASYRPG